MSVGASDIHVNRSRKGLRLRFRQDGVLQQYVEPLPRAVTSRFKILADLDIAERRQAQDGSCKYRDRVVDFRVNTLPSRFGEKVCLRLLDSGATQLGLDKTDPIPTPWPVRDLGSKPFGMILVTGPTGSGKSTTLYSLLAERNDPGINISTVGGPDRIHPAGHHPMPGEPNGFDFATAFERSCEDPDVLLVGETRDLETAKTAIPTDLVLSTLHANDAPSTIARLDRGAVHGVGFPDRDPVCGGSAPGALPAENGGPLRPDGKPGSGCRLLTRLALTSGSALSGKRLQGTRRVLRFRRHGHCHLQGRQHRCDPPAGP